MANGCEELTEVVEVVLHEKDVCIHFTRMEEVLEVTSSVRGEKDFLARDGSGCWNKMDRVNVSVQRSGERKRERM